MYPLVYLDNGATAQKPRQVIDKLVECLENYNANVHRGIHALGDRVTTELEAAREKVRQFVGAAEVEEIIFTSGTTMSINLVANAWGRKFLKAGDELLVNEMEHHANLVPWQQIARERGATLRFIPLTADGRLDLSSLDDVLTERTKLVAVTGLSNVLGTINPVSEIAAKAKARGALVLVDGAQSVPHSAINVTAPDIDFLAFSGHKLYGPTGIGVLYGKRRLLEGMDPFLCGGNMIRRVRKESSDFAELPSKFEAGTTPHRRGNRIGRGSRLRRVAGPRGDRRTRRHFDAPGLFAVVANSGPHDRGARAGIPWRDRQLYGGRRASARHGVCTRPQRRCRAGRASLHDAVA